jgi:hypothetical protein
MLYVCEWNTLKLIRYRNSTLQGTIVRIGIVCLCYYPYRANYDRNDAKRINKQVEYCA